VNVYRWEGTSRGMGRRRRHMAILPRALICFHVTPICASARRCVVESSGVAGAVVAGHYREYV